MRQPAKTFLFSLLCALFFSPVLAQDQLKMYEKAIEIPTYLVAEPDKNPYFYTGTTYQGAQQRIYPYAYDGNLTDEFQDVSYKGLFLENKYLEICVLPELGGRLYYMVDKTNDYNVIYRNNVIKPSMIGMLGAWISGGIEWNVPHHHRASTFMPTDYELVENDDGSKTIWVGELEIRHQVRWMVGLTLFPDNARLKIDFKYINQTPLAHSFLIWANTAVHANNDYQVIYPPLTEFAAYHGKNDFVEWPIANQLYRGYQFTGQDISWWKNIPSGGSFFAWEDQGQFVAGIDHGKDAGICVVGDPSVVVGKKLWTWGTSPRSQMWDKILSDNDGPYLEIMTGTYSNNQPDYSWCAPYFTKEATMNFMPLRGMTGVKESTLDAAINFELISEDKALLEVHGYGTYPDVQVSVSKGSEIIWSKTANLDPSVSLRWEIPLKNGYSIYELEVEARDASGKSLVSYKPVPKGKSLLPETVKPPRSPDEISTVEELCFTGLRLEQIYNPSITPLPYYLEALRREPKNAFANLQAGSWYLKEGIFHEAEAHLLTATDRWTQDYTRSKDGEALYLLGLSQKALGKEKEAFDSFNRASWDYGWFGASHLQLAMMVSKLGEYQKALDHINKALSVNFSNSRANEIKLSLLRKTGQPDEAENFATGLLKRDPLNLYVEAEMFINGKTGNADFSRKMRGEVQNYLDLAAKFGECGFYQEAIEVLDNATPESDNPLVFYYLAYFHQLTNNKEKASDFYQKASEMKVDYCFPFRFETEEVLSSAIDHNPDDFKAWYFWGNLLYDHQPQKAITNWEKAVSIKEDFAVAHRNLAFAADHYQSDFQKAAGHIAVAIKNDPSQPLYYFEQDNYALKLGASPELRLKNLNRGIQVIKVSDNPLARKVSLDLVFGDLDEALQILQNHHFRKVEGVGNIHNLWVDAWLTKGKILLEQGDNEGAIASFERSLEYPRNLEIGENNREGQSHYFLGLAYEQAKNKKLATEHFTMAISKDFGSYTLFFKGQALSKIGKKEEAMKIFNDLVKTGDEILTAGENRDYFAKFGTQEASNVTLAQAYSLKGLGSWGLQKKSEAEEYFKKALEQDPSNFEARSRLLE